MYRFLLYPLVGLITFALGVGAIVLVMTASQGQPAEVTQVTDVAQTPDSLSIPPVDPQPPDSYVAGSADKITLTKASKTFDVVVDPGPCSADDQCGPIVITLYRKKSTKPFQTIVGGRIAKMDLTGLIQFVDLDMDGVKDLALFDGLRAPAGLGIVALRIYLFSPTARQFILNSALSELSQSEGIDCMSPDKKRGIIMTYARPGGGYFQWRGYSMVDNEPALVYESTEDATVENGTITLRTTKKLINGRWRTWEKSFKGPLNQ